MLSTMSAGMLRTCGIFLITLALSLPLGFLVAFGRMSRWAPFAFINRSKKEHGHKENNRSEKNHRKGS